MCTVMNFTFCPTTVMVVTLSAATPVEKPRVSRPTRGYQLHHPPVRQRPVIGGESGPGLLSTSRVCVCMCVRACE